MSAKDMRPFFPPTGPTGPPGLGKKDTELPAELGLLEVAGLSVSAVTEFLLKLI